MGELTNFTFQQEVTDRVRKIIMDAMPQDVLQAALKTECEKYFFDKTDRYGSKEKSPFSRLVESEIRSQTQTRVSEEVRKYLSAITDFNPERRSQEVLAAITPAVQEALMRQAAADVARVYVNGISAARPSF